MIDNFWLCIIMKKKILKNKIHQLEWATFPRGAVSVPAHQCITSPKAQQKLKNCSSMIFGWNWCYFFRTLYLAAEIMCVVPWRLMMFTCAGTDTAPRGNVAHSSWCILLFKSFFNENKQPEIVNHLVYQKQRSYGFETKFCHQSNLHYRSTFPN